MDSKIGITRLTEFRPIPLSTLAQSATNCGFEKATVLLPRFLRQTPPRLLPLTAPMRFSKPPTNAFDEISQQNSAVDAVVDGLVQSALERIDSDQQQNQKRGDEAEIKKTSLLLLLFGLLGK